MYLVPALILASRSLSAGGWGLLPNGCAHSISAKSDHVLHILLDALDGRTKFNIVAVVRRRVGHRDADWETVQITLDRHGRLRRTVLEPLASQGIESSDDGVNFKFYNPDDKVLTIQPSPHGRRFWFPDRKRLIEQNYSLSMKGKNTVAFRPAWHILASPKHTELPARVFYVDCSTNFLLRLDLIRHGNSGMRLETLKVSYPAHVDPGLFDISPPPGAKIKRRNPPEPIVKESEAAKLLGFAPTFATKLPFGFRVERMLVDRGRRWKALVVSMSDGLAHASIFEWQAHNDDHHHHENDAYYARVGELSYFVATDLGSAAARRFLDAFAAAQRTGAFGPLYAGLCRKSEPTSEPNRQSTAFRLLRSKTANASDRRS